MARVTLANPIHISSQDLEHERASVSPRTGSQTSSESPPQRIPMAIPSLRYHDAPPPLPPPRFIDGLPQGIDLGWKWANREELGGHRTLAPIKQSSSMYGGYMSISPGLRGGSLDDEDEGIDGMDLDDDYDRKDSTLTSTSPSQAELKNASLEVGRIQNLTRRPTSPLAASNQRLHGERPLAQQSLNRSSHAYDKHLLSRIGKPSSPPRRLKSEPEESSSLLAQQRTINTRDVRLSPSSRSDTPLSSSIDPTSKWITSPINSAGLSPGRPQAWRDHTADYRSSSVDESAPPSVVDRDFFPRLREGNRHAPSGLLSGPENALAQGNRSSRGSYERGFFIESEHDFSIEEAGTFRKLSLGESRFSHAERRASFSKGGMKRRALSPPGDVARDDKVPALAAIEPYSRVNTANFATRSPNTRYLKYGSVSSTASSAPQESYASSTGLSAAGSSMTSVSSFGRGYSPSSRLSPIGGVESGRDREGAVIAGEWTQVTSVVAPKSIPSLSITTSKNATEQRTSHPSTKMSTQPPTDDASGRHVTGGGRLTGHYICECCPKKPKKFETANELRLHQMEKQYTCQYCQNRFKNKNEAERHQNSLHLRHHSWACSAISGPEAAFHPSTSPASQTPNGPLSDSCGYCGDEFPNHPQPDWDRRVEHLTNVHKFGECNQSKKFFRADHFRQHLKHSHSGRSGKWTNMLETACMREEPQDLGTGTATSSPTGEQSTRASSAIPPHGRTP